MTQNGNDAGSDELVRRYPDHCSFCRKHYREVGPLAEGPDLVYICRQCARACRSLIEDECRRLGAPLPVIGEGGYHPVSMPISLIKRIALSHERDDGGEGCLFQRYPGWCSFCRWNYRDAGPLAEGPDQVFVCYRCIELCETIYESQESGG